MLQSKLFKNKDHHVPDFSTAELESKLRKVATRGVVKLFNAIKTHQRTHPDAAGDVRERTDLATKKKFMESLKRGSSKSTDAKSKSAAHDSDDDSDDNQVSSKSTQKPSKGSSAPSWEVLRDDYMLGAKMKDWNKESDEE